MLNPSQLYSCGTCNNEFDGHSVNHCIRCGTITCTECMPVMIVYAGHFRGMTVHHPICKACSDATAIPNTDTTEADPDSEVGGIERDFSEV